MAEYPLTAKAEPSGFRKFIRADKTQRALLIISFMFVPLALLLMFTYIPFGKMVQFSFYNRNYLSEGTFVGIQNYIEVFKRDDIFGSLIVSVYYMGGAVVQLVLALFFASLMVFKVKGEGIYKACMFFPYLICGIAVGFIFKFFYARGFVLDSILQFFGMELENIPYWLQDQRINNITHPVIDEEIITSPRRYHTITEAKNGEGATPIKTEKGWLHIAHGVRNTAAGLRYVVYVFVTDLHEPWKVIAEPSGFLIAPRGWERVGDVSNVVFTNGAIARDNGEVYIYYAASDTRLHVASTTVDRLLDFAFHTPSDPLRSCDCVAQRCALIERNSAYLASLEK